MSTTIVNSAAYVGHDERISGDSFFIFGLRGSGRWFGPGIGTVRILRTVKKQRTRTMQNGRAQHAGRSEKSGKMGVGKSVFFFLILRFFFYEYLLAIFVLSIVSFITLRRYDYFSDRFFGQNSLGNTERQSESIRRFRRVYQRVGQHRRSGEILFGRNSTETRHFWKRNSRLSSSEKQFDRREFNHRCVFF